ncbi:MAG TPA: hypothetical protein VM327_00755 [Candidatus Thermoplasmatota archaeon]|nr:hypothetical protein [Candidatus Thermoplasmatota archaeon]
MPRRAHLPPALPTGTHSTQVFGGPFPYHEVAALAKAAVAAGEIAVLILQPRRLQRMKAILAKAKGILYVDTIQALAAMTRSGRLDDKLVGQTLGPLIADAAGQGNGRVAIFTDAAGTLVLKDRVAESRLLEELCHGVCATGPVFLVCVYPIDAYSRLGEFAQAFRHEHGLGQRA